MDTGTDGTGTDLQTGSGHAGKFGTKSIPVPATSVSSVRHQYTGTGHFGKFGTSTPVPPVAVRTSVPELLLVSVQHRYRCRIPR